MSKKHQTLSPRMARSGPFTVEASGYEPVKGETIPRRNPAAKDGLISTPSEDVTTIFDILKRSADNFGNAKALGLRQLTKIHSEIKKVKKTVDGKTEEVNKKWTYYEMTQYKYMSFIEYEQMALQIGCGLRKLGLAKNDRVHLYAGTRYNLVSMCFAIFVSNLICVSLAPIGLACLMGAHHNQLQQPRRMTR